MYCEKDKMISIRVNSALYKKVRKLIKDKKLTINYDGKIESSSYSWSTMSISDLLIKAMEDLEKQFGNKEK